MEVVFVTNKKVSCKGPEDSGHPLIYLDLGDELEKECPYCSRIFKFKTSKE